MTPCPKCGKENQAHFKFCLFCGATLPIAQLANTVGLDQLPAKEPRRCPKCGSSVEDRFVFCPACGSPMADSQANRSKPPTSTRHPVMGARPGGKLVLVKPDGSEAGVHPLQAGENLIGRNHSPLFELDGYLSPEHAKLILNEAGAVVQDLHSTNGVFIKISREERLTHDDIFRIGQELIRFESVLPSVPDAEGTETLGSPHRGHWGRLCLVYGKTDTGPCYPLFGDGVILGRERGDITFPEDGYVSAKHARVVMQNGHVVLADLNSSNGTFLRLRSERSLPTGSHLLMGQQLFRLEFT